MIKFHINAGNLWSLSQMSAVPRQDGELDYLAIKHAGFDGLQHYYPEPAALEAGLEMSGMARITKPSEAIAIANQHSEWGFVASTWHVGTGFEADDEMNALIGALLDAEAKTGLPIFIETHRATITQDVRRTLDLIDRFPTLRFNADLSHWYSGLEMPYGDFEAKLDLLEPVFERVGFMHGRIGHSSTMQLPLAEARQHPCWAHYQDMWSRCLKGFDRSFKKKPDLIFAPELLPARIEYEGQEHFLNYAREIHGQESSDRWSEALELVQVIEELAAQKDLAFSDQAEREMGAR